MIHFGFVKALAAAKARGLNPVIAEIKPYSPIYGDMLRGRDVLSILKAYEKAGASAVSYITAKQFGGSFKDLVRICKETELPVLRKDFITDVVEVERSAAAEASALLLISRVLKDEIFEFADLCREHGICPVVEVHSEGEIRYVREVALINNRDISRLETDSGDVKVTLSLAPKIKAFKISGSGIYSVADVKLALSCTDAVLVGTAFMMADDIERKVREFVEVKV